MSTLAEEIEKLYELFQKDILTAEEFKAAKSAAVAKRRSAAPASSAPESSPGTAGLQAEALNVRSLHLANHEQSTLDGTAFSAARKRGRTEDEIFTDAGTSLIICVDEIGYLDNNVAIHTMRDLMTAVDGAQGKLIIIFTHILNSFIRAAEAGSGRPVIVVELSHITMDVVMQSLPRPIHKACQDNPRLHQLVLSCCGHPRATFDFLPYVFEQYRLEEPNQERLILARREIIAGCKLQQSTVDLLQGNPSPLELWFSVVTNPTVFAEDKWTWDALLHRLSGGVRCLFPLLITAAVEAAETPPPGGQRSFDSTSLTYHLCEAYSADQLVSTANEKKMEEIMFHFEAVLRICTAGKSFSLEQFYGDTEHIDPKLTRLTVTAPVPAGKPVTANFQNFGPEHQNDILKLLWSGYIVISDKLNEVGVEYLVSFLDEDSNLIVGAVQCKMLVEKTDWTSIKGKMHTAAEWLESRQAKGELTWFPVVYTTVTQHTIKDTTYRGDSLPGVYFTAKDLFWFTNKLGILRLHTEKLGDMLAKEVPLLRATSVVTRNSDDGKAEDARAGVVSDGAQTDGA